MERTDASRPSPRQYYVLAVLFATYAMNFADRQILGILGQSVKISLGLSDWQLGLINGPAIGLFYAAMGLPLAYLADRVNRTWLLAVCLVGWSGLTALGGFAASFLQLAATRLGVSLAEAAGTPISASLISDYFPPERRGSALGIYSAGTVAGVLVSFTLGGLLADRIGWRGTMIAAGAPGLMLAAIVMLTVSEPRRGGEDKVAASAGGGSFLQLSLPATVWHLWRVVPFRGAVLAGCGANFGVAAILAWVPAFLARNFGVNAGRIGLTVGLGISIVGGLAMIGGGLLVDRLVRRHIALAPLLSGITQFISIPLLVAGLLAPSFETSAILLTLSYAATVFYAPTSFLLSQSAVPTEVRALAAAVMTLSYSLIGIVIAPPLVGALSDYLAPTIGTRSLQAGLLLVVLPSAISGLLFLRLGRHLKHADAIASTGLSHAKRSPAYREMV